MPAYDVFFPLDITVSPGGTASVAWRAPQYYGSTAALELMLIPRVGADVAGADIDLTLEHGAIGEQEGFHSSINTSSTYDFTGRLDLYTSLDLLSMVDAITEGDICRLDIVHANVAGDIYYAGLRWAYTTYS